MNRTTVVPLASSERKCYDSLHKNQEDGTDKWDFVPNIHNGSYALRLALHVVVRRNHRLPVSASVSYDNLVITRLVGMRNGSPIIADARLIGVRPAASSLAFWS